MNSVAVDIADILVLSSSGLSLTLATDLFIGQEPKTPNECVTIYDRPGFAPTPVAETYDQPGFMIRVRGNRNDYAGAYEIAQDIKAYLHKMASQSVGSTRYVQILAEGDSNFIGYDDNQRPVFTLNFLCHRTGT